MAKLPILLFLLYFKDNLETHLLSLAETKEIQL